MKLKIPRAAAVELGMAIPFGKRSLDLDLPEPADECNPLLRDLIKKCDSRSSNPKVPWGARDGLKVTANRCREILGLEIPKSTRASRVSEGEVPPEGLTYGASVPLSTLPIGTRFRQQVGIEWFILGKLIDLTFSGATVDIRHPWIRPDSERVRWSTESMVEPEV